MRVGTNPLKGTTGVSKPNLVTITLLVCIPNEQGYFRQSLDVLRLVLASIHKNTTIPYDVLIFDNGSCKQVKDFLVGELRQGRIQYLILSDSNIGKVAAWNVIFGSAQGEYIAYADGDVFFYPGWLEAHLELIQTFPNVGMVTGLPMRHLTNFETTSTLKLAEETPSMQIQKGHLIGNDIIEDFCNGVGLEVNEYLEKYAELEEIQLEYRGVTAFVGASHFQFVSPKQSLVTCLPLRIDESTTLVGRSERQLDERLNATGCMRLSTSTRYVSHLGNTLTKKWSRTAREYSQSDNQKSLSGSELERFHFKRLSILEHLIRRP